MTNFPENTAFGMDDKMNTSTAVISVINRDLDRAEYDVIESRRGACVVWRFELQ